MKTIMSTRFRVIYFPHDGRIVTIDQLSFVGPDLTIKSMTSLNGSYMQMVSPSPQVNYAALYPMPLAANENKSLTIISIYYELDLVVDMVISLIWILELDLFTHVMMLDMVSFQSVSLPSSEDLLEAMTEFFPLTWCPSRVFSSWKP